MCSLVCLRLPTCQNDALMGAYWFDLPALFPVGAGRAFDPGLSVADEVGRCFCGWEIRVGLLDFVVEANRTMLSSDAVTCGVSTKSSPHPFKLTALSNARLRGRGFVCEPILEDDRSRCAAPVSMEDGCEVLREEESPAQGNVRRRGFDNAALLRSQESWSARLFRVMKTTNYCPTADKEQHWLTFEDLKNKSFLSTKTAACCNHSLVLLRFSASTYIIDDREPSRSASR